MTMQARRIHPPECAQGNSVKQRPTILIVDRNSNVREYLIRELGCEGYHIHQAENCRELFQRISAKPKIDIIIIDPDLPDVEEKLLLRKLKSTQPRIPIVIHTFIADYLNPGGRLFEAVSVEKDGNSVERLKQVVKGQLDLKRPAPEHFPEVASGVGRKIKKTKSADP